VNPTSSRGRQGAIAWVEVEQCPNRLTIWLWDCVWWCSRVGARARVTGVVVGDGEVALPARTIVFRAFSPQL
jgi:hypothetical protein